MNQLLEEFDPISYETWLNQLKKDLKDKSLQDLASHPEPDLSIIAYHHRDTASNIHFQPGIEKTNNDWKIRQACSSDEDKNHLLLESLNQGVEAIGIHVYPRTNFKALTKGILFEHIETDISFDDLKTAKEFTAPPKAILNFDMLALNYTAGTAEWSLDDFYTFYESHLSNKRLWISGSIYGETGASTVQELAFTLNHLNEYIHFLYAKGVSLMEINENIVIELSVNDNYFVNIAKFRVIQELVGYVFKNYDKGYKYKAVTIYAKTNIRHLALNDVNNNVLRETTQAMSAVIGGCDALTINFLEIGKHQDRKRTKRIAKNIQLILKEEAYLNTVVDPSQGSYFIESLSTQLTEKAWALFFEVENKGGISAEMRKNEIQAKIKANKTILVADLVENNKIFLGINKHPNPMENWIDISPIKPPDSPSDFEPLRPFYLENHFIKTDKAHG